MVRDILEKSVKNSLEKLDLESGKIHFEHPMELSHGDYSTNVALVLAKKEKEEPKKLAEEIADNIKKPKEVEKIKVVGGFINFFLSKEFFANSLKEATKKDFGKNKTLKGKKIMLEYTDPNPFKLFHIGHLMSNTIGESLSRLAEYTGAEIKRVNYQGDVGMHVAMSIWGLMQKPDLNPSDVYDQGTAYVYGYQNFENNKEEITGINKKIFEKSDEKINEIYKKGKEASLKYFEKQYKKLDTKFDHYFFESEASGSGKEIVENNMNLFQKSDGAVVFKGENYGLHTRVFINSEGLPTYEAKELGLAKTKYDTFPYDQSFIITANEINAYFEVLLEVMKHVYEKEGFSEKTTHVGHGMLRLPEGKMSSRTGDVISADSLLGEITSKVLEVMLEREVENKKEVADIISIGALKYSILKQAIGKNIIFDFDKAISFEGDSGPYLQYTYVRAKSVLKIAQQKNLTWTSDVQVEDKLKNKDKNYIPTHLDVGRPSGWGVTEVERILYRFPEIVERAWEEKAPQHLATFLIELASAFNSFYAKEKILEEGGGYKLLLTEAVANVLKNGLYLLGIKVPERM